MRVRMILAFFVLAATSLVAQTFRGTILGTVTDPSGAVVSGAKVTVRNMDTGLERTTQTSEDGGYSRVGIAHRDLHRHDFAERISDFCDQRRRSGRGPRTPCGCRTETGQVAADGGSVRRSPPTDRNDLDRVGRHADRQTIENLPVNGRDYTKLIYLNPGVAGSPDQISDSPGSYGTFSMNGSRGRSNNFLLDGTDMNDGYRNDPAINEAGVFGDPATILPIDAVAELRTLSNYEAEYGRNSGAVVNIVTKSGTNTWHGSALEYFAKWQAGARNYFNFAPDSEESISATISSAVRWVGRS